MVYYSHGNVLFLDEESELSYNLFDDYHHWFIRGGMYSSLEVHTIARANQNASIMTGNSNEDAFIV